VRQSWRRCPDARGYSWRGVCGSSLGSWLRVTWHAGPMQRRRRVFDCRRSPRRGPL
jgi:hypothetical protein